MHPNWHALDSILCSCQAQETGVIGARLNLQLRTCLLHHPHSSCSNPASSHGIHASIRHVYRNMVTCSCASGIVQHGFSNATGRRGQAAEGTAGSTQSAYRTQTNFLSLNILFTFSRTCFAACLAHMFETSVSACSLPQRMDRKGTGSSSFPELWVLIKVSMFAFERCSSWCSEAKVASSSEWLVCFHTCIAQ